MRIAHFTNTYWPTVNGVAVSDANLRDGLIELGHEIDVFAPAVRGHGPDQDPEGVFRYPSIPAIVADYSLALPFSKEIRARLDRGGYDVVHSSHQWWVGAWALDYAVEQRLPFVTTRHTQQNLYACYVPLPRGMACRLMRRLALDHYARADLVTTPGLGSVQSLRDMGVTTPIEVVSNPTRLDDFWNANGSAVRADLGITEDEIVLGYVGRLTREKNIGVILEAYKLLTDKGLRVRLLLVGGGRDEARLRKLAAGIPGVIFVGKIPHDKINAYYGAMDLFVTASMSEVQPMSFAEALAAGVPIVAFDVSGCNDMVCDLVNGRLVDPRRGTAGLAETIEAMVGDPVGLLALSVGAKDWVHRYDIVAATEAMVKAYVHAIWLHNR